MSKIPKSFRLDEDLSQQIKDLSSELETTETEVFNMIIKGYFSNDTQGKDKHASTRKEEARTNNAVLEVMQDKEREQLAQIDFLKAQIEIKDNQIKALERITERLQAQNLINEQKALQEAKAQAIETQAQGIEQPAQKRGFFSRIAEIFK